MKCAFSRPSVRLCAALAGVSAAVGVGCAPSMARDYNLMRSKLVMHDYMGAEKYLESVKEADYSKDNRLLYYMNTGMVLNLAQHYAESNAAMENAKIAAQQLWTESVGANAAAWVTTDNAIPYQGEDFEKVLLHFVAALNYVGLRSYGDARVEARQITDDLELYNSKYKDKQSAYRDDAFSRWLSGRLAETDTQDLQAYNDAWLDYRKALHVYESDYSRRYQTPVPTLVVRDALRVLQRLGGDFQGEYAQLRAKYPAVSDAMDGADNGRIVFVHMSGEAPLKQDRFWTAPTPTGVIRIAYPEFVSRPHAIQYARIAVRGTQTVMRTELMENITAIAVQNLRDHMGRIQAKATARQVAKYIAGSAAEVAGSQIGGTGGALLGLGGAVFNAASAITEEADKRSWTTLPADVTVGEMSVPPGAVTLDVDFMGPGEQILEHAEFQAQAESGKTVFLSYRTFR